MLDALITGLERPAADPAARCPVIRGAGFGIACCVDVALATPDALFGIT